MRTTTARPDELLLHNRALLRREDVLLASYPRSGNDWLRLMLADLLLQRAGARFEGRLEAPVHVSRIIPGIYRNDLRGTYRFAPVEPAIDLPFLVVKTHEPFGDLTDRAICLVRRCADALVSYYRFLSQRDPGVRAAGQDGFCVARAGDWAAFQRSYLALPAERVLFVTYEALRAAPAAQLARVLAFLGLPAEPAALEGAVARQALPLRQEWDRRRQGRNPALPRLVGDGRIGGGAETLSRAAAAAVAATADAVYRAASERAAE